jgi:hypothetical protein|tara:strand:+ start:849 stop:989 length:141 start_codon:yes stop_codon:yes gene_type:complete
MKGFLSGVWAGNRKAGNYWLANLSSLSGRAEVFSQKAISSALYFEE